MSWKAKIIDWKETSSSSDGNTREKMHPRTTRHKSGFRRAENHKHGSAVQEPPENAIKAKRRRHNVWGGAGPAHEYRSKDKTGHPAPGTLWYDREQPLSDIFPISARFVLKKSLLSLIILALVIGAYIFYVPFEHLLNPETFYAMSFFWVVRAALVFAIGQVIYWELYRRTLVFGTDGFRLHISKGVIKKKIGSIPLIPVTELVIKHDNLDILLGLHQLHVLAPVDSGDHLGVLEGLSRESANNLEEFLATQLNNQIFIPDIDVQKAEGA
jgi:hypothetical protein